MKNFYRPLLNLLLFIPLLLNAKTPSIYIGAKPFWVEDTGLKAFQPNPRDIEKGYYLSKLEQQIHVEKEAMYQRIVRDIVSETGVQNASEISVSFDPSYEKITFHKIVVWRNNKALNKLRIKDFKVIADEKDLSQFVYQGTYSAYLILEDIRKGDRIEFSYTREGRNPVFGGKYSSVIYLQEYSFISHNYISLVASSARNLRLKYFNGAVPAKTVSKDGMIRYSWESFKQPPLKYEDDTPGWFDICPKVQFTEYASWEEVARWAASVNPPGKLSGESAAFVASLKDKYKNDKEGLFRAAVRFVQDEVRYMGIEFGIHSHKASLPEKVFKQRYGDCKDKALLLVSMLQTLGFEADLALLSTIERDYLKNYLPSPRLFDHAVVRAVVNGKPVWVDATMQYQGGSGTQIYFPNYGRALVTNTRSKGLTAIPVHDRGRFSVFENYSVDDKDAPVELTVKTVYRGYEADYMRQVFASKGISEKEKAYFKYYASSYPKIKSLDSLVLKDDLLRNELITLEKYSIPEFFDKDSVNHTYDASFYAGEISNVLPKIDAGRKQPLYTVPIRAEHQISVAMNSGWNIDEDSNDISRKDYRFHSYHTAVGDTLKLQFEFELRSNYIPASLSLQLAEDVKLMKDEFLEYNITYTPKDARFLPNWPVIAATSILVVLFLTAAVYRNRLPTSNSYYQRRPIALGGWLIVVMLSLAADIIYSIIPLVDDKLLDLNIWKHHSERTTNVLYQTLLSTEIFTHVFVICMALFCLFLMWKKRDILPATISFYLGVSAILYVIIHIISTSLYGRSYSPGSELVYRLIGTFIWLAYFRSSERVKDTFVVPKVETEEEEELYEDEPEEVEH